MPLSLPPRCTLAGAGHGAGQQSPYPECCNGNRKRDADGAACRRASVTSAWRSSHPLLVAGDHRADQVLSMNPAFHDHADQMNDDDSQPNIRAHLVEVLRGFPTDLIEAHVAGNASCQSSEENRVNGIAARGVMSDEVLWLLR